jgi:hypothetical protein
LGNRVRSNQFVHRLVLAAFVGPCPEGMEVRHLDGNPANTRLANLRYGTHSENELDKVRHGTHHEARKTHCNRGHEYTQDNTRRRRDTGSRECLTCARWRDAKRYNPTLEVA